MNSHLLNQNGNFTDLMKLHSNPKYSKLIRLTFKNIDEIITRDKYNTIVKDFVFKINNHKEQFL